MARWLTVLTLLLCHSVAIAQSGKLGEVREEVNRSSERPSKKKRRRNDRHCDQDTNSFLADLIVAVLFASPSHDPHCDHLETTYIDTGEGYVEQREYIEAPVAQFPRFPYWGDHEGHLWFGRTIEGCNVPDPEPLRWWSVRASVENGNDFDGLNRVGGRIVWDTSSGWGVRFDLDWFHENLDGGRRTDETFFTTTNLSYRFAEHEMIEWYLGLGLRTMNDTSISRAGMNFLFGVDVFLGPPLIWSTSFEAGWLGSADVYRIRSTLGVTYNGFEFFGGYDYLRIGSASLQGPMVGVRLWF